MGSAPLHSAFDALRARVHADLDAHLGSLESTIADQHAAALLEARRDSSTAAEREWSGRLEALRDEWAVKLSTALAAADDAAARRLGTALSRVEPGQAALSRREGPEASESSHAALARLAGSLRRIGEAPSLMRTLDALADVAAEEAPGAALFVETNDDAPGAAAITRWRPTEDAAPDAPSHEALAEAIRTRQATELPVLSPDADAPATTALLIPILVGEQAVAVLHAEGPAAAPWLAALQILAQHTSVCLSRQTAISLAQGVGALQVQAPSDDTPDDEDGARRYARLLVSEIKLYNESAVRSGRERRDLLTRLGPEIDHARRLYEERIPAALHQRAALFQRELIDTLAQGDRELLGPSA